MSSFTKRYTQRNKKTTAAWLGGLLVLLCALFVASRCVGSARSTIAELAEAMFQADKTDTAYRILFYVRLPRVLAAIVAGAALAVAGAVLQSVLNNALAGPNIIGVNSGSGLFVTLLVAFFPQYLIFMPLAAFLGAFFAAMIVYAVAYKSGASRITIILGGIAIGSFLSAITNAILSVRTDAVLSAHSFTIGSLAGVQASALSVGAVIAVVGIALALLLGREMNVLALGDEMAVSLGLKVQRTRLLLIIITALLAGCAVSIVGQLGFVGLLVPHIARLLIGYDNNRTVICASALIGAIFVLICDDIARMAFAPHEISVGIVVSVIGAPFFIYLLFKRRRGRLYD